MSELPGREENQNWKNENGRREIIASDEILKINFIDYE